jgi:peptidyl-prolyl cis-trans isomerase SurA
MKRLAVLALLCLFALPAFAQEVRIAAVVNDDVISIADLQARLRLVIASSNLQDTAQIRQRIAPQVLRTLIDEKLKMQEAKRLDIKVTDQEIAGAVARIEEQNHLPPGGLDAFLKQRDIDKRSLMDQLKATIAWGKLVRRRQPLTAAVSEDDIDAELARMRESAGQEQSRIAEIFLAVDDPSRDEEVKRLADRLYQQIGQGASFPAVAQQFSQSATAAVGGDVGWVTPEQLDPQLAPVVKSLHPGEMAPPVRATGGYYIVLLIDRRVLTLGSAADTKVSLVQVMFPVGGAEDEAKARADAQAVSDKAKSCEDMLRIGREEAPQTSGDLGEIKADEVPAELRKLVLDLPVGVASPPVALRGGIGVIMVCARSAPPSTLPSRQEIADSITRERLERLARRYLRDLRRAAFIDIRG